MRNLMKYFKIYIFIAALINGLSCIAQTNEDSKFIDGSDGFKSIDCKDLCTIVYQDFVVNTKKHQQSPGEDISIYNNKTQKKIVINVDREYNAQYFNRLFDRYALIDYGTSSFRKIYIYDLDNEMVINFIDYVSDQVEIINGKLHCFIGMSEGKINRNKLAQGQCLTQTCGFFEEIYYNFKTNEIEFTGKYEWRQ